MLESISFPEPVISVVIEPRTQADEEKLNDALQRLADEDPTFRVRTDEDTGQTIMWGMGELHLDILLDRMLREFRVQANVGKQQVAYREAITRRARGEGEMARQMGTKLLYGHVVLELRTAAAVQGLCVQKAVRPEVIPPQFIPAIEQAVREAMESGSLAGYPMVGDQGEAGGRLVSGRRSDGIAYRTAASMAFQQAVQQAAPVLLEPVMSAEVLTPEEFTGDVIGNLNARRAEIEGMKPRGDMQAMTCVVPLAEMFGYATALRSCTQGRGTFTMEFSHYAELPPEIAQPHPGWTRL